MWLEGAVWAESGAWFTVEGLVAFAAGRALDMKG